MAPWTSAAAYECAVAQFMNQWATQSRKPNTNVVVTPAPEMHPMRAEKSCLYPAQSVSLGFL